MHSLFNARNTIFLSACLICLLAYGSLDAQSVDKPEGYYIYQRYNLWVAQAKQSGKDISLKLLWTNSVLNLHPLTDSSFFSHDESEADSTIVTFRKNSEGAYTQFFMSNYGLWERDKNYVPVTHTEIDHTPEQLKVFEGYYLDTSGKFLHIQEQDNHLLLKKLWDNNEISFVPDSIMHFFCKGNTTYTIGFFKKSEGDLSMDYDGELWEKLRKPIISVAGWKAFEGTYRSKDDPDNLIRISAKNNSLSVKQLWNGVGIEAYPLSTLFFSSSDQSFTILFKDDMSGASVMNKNQFERIKN